MKPIQNQYIDLKEGRISKPNFMKSLRMTFPQYVTNVTSFEDSIKILKNKRILTESSDFEGTPSNTAVTYERSAGPVIGLYEDYTAEQIVDEYNDLKDNDPNASFADVANKLGISEDDVANAVGLGAISTSESLREALADKKSQDNSGKFTEKVSKEIKGISGEEQYKYFTEDQKANWQEVKTGINIEHICEPDKSYADIQKIVIKNLQKHPNYYTLFKLTGIRGYVPETMDSSKPEDHQMKFVEKDNWIDKARGMKPIKGFEDAKADANKAKKETVKGEKTNTQSLVAKSTRGVKKMDATGEKTKIVVMKEIKISHQRLSELIDEVIMEIGNSFSGDNMSYQDEKDYGSAGPYNN